MTKPFKRHRHKVLSPTAMQNLKRQWLKHNPPDENGYYQCWICPHKVHKSKLTLDHVMSVEDWPEYAKELSNLRPAHKFCNQERASSTLNRLRSRKILKKL